MRSAKVAVTIDQDMLRDVDRWVAAGEFPSRSRAFQTALSRLREERGKRSLLLRELAKLDPDEERELANETLGAEVPWPEY